MQEPRSYTVTVSTASRVVIPEESLTIELIGVKDDRCAVEVKCVWAGNAEITLRVSKAGGAPTSLVIGTLVTPQAGSSSQATYDAYRFSVAGLEPDNSISKPVEQSRYRARLLVSKRSGQ